MESGIVATVVTFPDPQCLQAGYGNATRLLYLAPAGPFPEMWLELDPMVWLAPVAE